MNDESRARRIDRAFRLLLLAVAALWLLLPPRPAVPAAQHVAVEFRQ